MESVENLFSLFIKIKENGEFPNYLIYLGLAFLIVTIVYIIKCTVSIHLEQKRIKFNYDHDTNTAALVELYGPLYLYVLDKQDLKNYSPEQAKKFLTDIKAIINKSPYYSTTFLDSQLLNIESALKKRKPEYSKLLVDTRSYIITIYESVRRSLNYPTTSKKDNFFYTSTPASRLILLSYIFFLIAIILACIDFIFVLTNPQEPSAVIFRLFLLTAFISFLMCCVIFGFVAFICAIVHFRNNHKLAKKWFPKEHKESKNRNNKTTNVSIPKDAGKE